MSELNDETITELSIKIEKLAKDTRSLLDIARATASIKLAADAAAAVTKITDAQTVAVSLLSDATLVASEMIKTAAKEAIEVIEKARQAAEVKIKELQ